MKVGLKKTKSKILILAVFMVVLAGRSFAEQTFYRDSAWNKTYSKGMEQYNQNCAGCHGEDGEGGMGLPLNLQSFLKVAPADYIEKTIKYGRQDGSNDRIMPAFEKILTSRQIKNITTYIKGWQYEDSLPLQKSVKGNVKNGKELFKGMCIGCHGLNGEGGEIGLGHVVGTLKGFSAPSLSNKGFLKAASDGYIKATLMYGRVGTPMGAYLKGQQGFVELTEKDINDLVVYIRSLE